MSFSEWEEVKLSDIMNIIGGGTPKTKVNEYWGGDIPWLSVKDFNIDIRTVYTTEKNITQLGLENSSTKILNKGDIIISARGTVGALAQLGKPMAFNQSCYGLRANSKTTNDFLYYLLKYKLNTIKKNTHGSVFDTITKKTFDLLSAYIPKDKNEQKAIAKILSSLDEKIEVNNQINKKFEEMAQAIFKHWFIDFEFPNENGEPYKSSGGEMVESELGMIPVGWEVKKMDEVAKVVGGATPSKKKKEYYTNNGIPWITPKDLSSITNKFVSHGNQDISEEGLKNSSTHILQKGAVLYSSRAPIGYIAIAKNELTTNQGFKSLIPRENISNEYLYYMLISITERIRNVASGSTFKEISGKVMKKIKIVMPNNVVMNRFHTILTKVSNIILKNEEEIIVLDNLRDILLSKLMSGEIRVPLENSKEEVQ